MGFAAKDQALRFIDVDYAIWEANGFHDKLFYITEWNNTPKELRKRK